MVNITLKNNSGHAYPVVRDLVCSHLRGNRGYIENDIIVSDCNEDKNEICFSLGDDNTDVVNIIGTIETIESILK